MIARFSIPLLMIITLALMTGGCASRQATFNSPDEAVGALVSALRADDTAKLNNLFGPEGDEIVSSGDAISDRAEIGRFLAAYDTQHRLQTESDGSSVLIVGDDDWPFPVPIIKSGNQYIFDTETGKDELLNRRIGRNELSTELVCLAIVDAQRDYVALRPAGGDLPVYARKLLSDPGTKNGLYWPTSADEPPSPLGPLVAMASAEGYTAARPTGEAPPPYHGYRYRLLTAQGQHALGGSSDYVVNGQLIGGFAVIAYPANYGSSGIMTFITNHDGVVYERDLGPDTEKTAQEMKEFDPGPGWTKSSDASKVSLSEQ